MKRINKVFNDIIKYNNFYMEDEPNRPMMKLVKKNTNRESLVGVEIGTSKGCHAVDILYHLNIKKLYLIDPYCLYNDRLKTNQNVVDYEFNKVKDEANKSLMRFEGKYEFIYKKSNDAINFVPDDLDFVYIDGDHNYECVKKDIEMYYAKVKDDGIIGGHDFGLNFPGVIKAVLDFIEYNKIETYHSEILDWWIVKNNGKKNI